MAGKGGSNKNQTAQERAKAKAAIASLPTRHRCSGCAVLEPITNGDLSIFVDGRKWKTLAFHKACAPKI